MQNDFKRSIEYLVQVAVSGERAQCKQLVKENSHTITKVKNYLYDMGYNDSMTLTVIEAIF